MSGMARAGGGHGYFIEHARQIGDLLTSELAESLEVVARGASLSIHAPQGARVELLTDFDARQEGDTTTVRLGNLVSGQSITIVLKVTLPDGVEGEQAVLGIRAGAEEGALDAPPVEVRWTWASHERNDAQPRETAVDLQVAGIYAARARRDALELNRRGDYDGARRLLERVAKRIEGYAGASLELQGLARALRAEARQFEREMDSMSMKQAHYSSRAAMRSRSLTGKATRGRYDAQAYDVRAAPRRADHRLRRGPGRHRHRNARQLWKRACAAGWPESPPAVVGGSRRHRGVHRPVPGHHDRCGDRRRPSAAVRVPDRPRHEEGGVVPWKPRLRWRVAAHAAAAGRSDRGDHGLAPGRGSRFSTPARGCRTSIPRRSPDGPWAARRTSFPSWASSRRTSTRPTSSWRAFSFAARFGVLPQPLQQSMAALGAQWVIGSELLQQFPLLLDLQHHRIMIVQQQPSFMAIH